MSNWTLFFNISIGIVGLVLSILGLLLSLVLSPPVMPSSRRYSNAIFGVLIAYNATILLSYVSEVEANALGMRWGIFLSSLFSSLLMPVLTDFMLELCGEPRRGSRLFWTVAVLWGLYFGMLLSTLFSPAIYAIDDAGVYRRGPLYALLLIPPVLIMLLNLWGLWRRRGRLSARQRLALLLFLALPLVGMVVQIFYYGVLTTALGVILGAMAMFVFILLDQMDSFIRQTEENAQKAFDIRILQMRPHFIYNAMTSIYYITEENPKKGQSVIRDFTIYLRKVFDSVTRREPVPFTEELEHTRAYLAVEQARFEDQLSVTFDTPHTDFRLPPLTLQPIVENAVKHGIDPEIERVSVVIRTRAVDGGSEIVVENDGADYIPTADGGEGVGLGSTRARVERMCGGKLTIAPREGGGAVVTLFLPD